MVESSIFRRWRPDMFARKWHALAKRRRDHLAELYDSGRWRRYYTEETFRAQMREVVQDLEHWHEVTRSDVVRPVANAEARPAAPPRAA